MSDTEVPSENRLIEKITFVGVVDTKGTKKRITSKVDRYGKFESVGLYSAPPRDFLQYASVQSGDPTLVLKDGDRLRAFQGGDPRHLTAQSQGLIDNHETFYRNKRQSTDLYDTDPFLSFPFGADWSGSSD